MTLDQAILDKRVIEISFSSMPKLAYTGICLKANKHLWLIINFDFKKQIFDGFSVFRNADIVSFAVFKKKYLFIKDNNLADFLNILPFNKINTFYSCLKELPAEELIAFFTGDNHISYDVGKILYLNKQEAHVKLIDKKGNWIQTIVFKITDIHYFSFMSVYEKGLLKKAISIENAQLKKN